MFRRKHRRPTPPSDPGSELVELLRVSAIEAEIVVARLRSAGIEAAVFGPGTAGENAAILYSEGGRVMVRRRDAEEAAALLAE